ncbi:DegT/DnrJ/EryC1/StrS family aminotransferase [Leptospira ilyithenensis]|uniref:DegT/DnrJ/EryC1/StrS family aminotransferase n=1 Tax=Leptospira ilyithenensis TaxID=2484901 RepID=A0A4R9LPC3_9LEPT|nr:DegT/DnrJ/EryC1/StrS family aminotransferase [Leptospira ilyithenensis]TGN08021.1 DegT/DnrJ/EryC1/StrS family aminotransferase [Leptospira ilyithenensis]
MNQVIKVWDYLEELQIEKDEVMKLIEKVLFSGRLIFGESLLSFERSLSEYIGLKYGIGVDNATNATMLSLKALNIGENDEVITVPNTAVPTVSAIISAGAKPVFVDIDPETYLMDTSQVRKAITDKTKAIVPVHLYGQSVDMDPIIAIAKEFNLKISEDCAQSHGAEYKGKKAGSFSDCSTFSFYPTKPLGGFGDAGMILTNNAETNDKLRRLRFYGMDKVYYAEEHGYNSRVDELHAAILDFKLKKLDENNNKRREIATRYNGILKDSGLKLPVEKEYNKHVYYLYVVAHPERDRILDELKKENILLNVSYPFPIHTMRGYSHLGYKQGDFPVTEKLSNEIFSLPMYPYLSEESQTRVCNVLKSIIG